jgi:hypothetical protein
MSACDRFEAEGLARFVAGERLDPHFGTCPDCLQARTSYQAIVQTLGHARTAYAPSGDWETRVWARIRRNGDPATAARMAGPRWAFVRWGAGAVAVAAVAVLVVQSSGGPAALELTTTLGHGSGPAVRGAPSSGGPVLSAAPGDLLELSARIPRRNKVSDLRVYRGNDELVFQCSTSPACTRTRDGIEARVTLDKPGTYRTMVLVSENTLPPSTGNLDADYAAALRAGTAHESPPIEVL